MASERRQVDFRRALEALRNGVPNRDAVRVLGTNQGKAELALVDLLAAGAACRSGGLRFFDLVGHGVALLT